MDVSEVACSGSVAAADCLQNYDFGVTLRQFKCGEGPEFRDRCLEFFDRLVEVILSQHCMSVDFNCCLYCFCPKLLLEGDDKQDFDLSRKLV